MSNEAVATSAGRTKLGHGHYPSTTSASWRND